jgi:hypothetical protein
LFLSTGTQYLSKAGISIAFDSMLVIVFCMYFLGVRRERSRV